MNTPSAPLAERVAALYRAARDLAKNEASASRVIRLPPVTAAGLESAGAVLRFRPDLSVAAGRMLQHAARIPPSS